MTTSTNGVVTCAARDSRTAVNFNRIIAITGLHPVADTRENGVVAFARNNDIGTLGVCQVVIAGTGNQGVAVGTAAEVITPRVVEVGVGDGLRM